MIFRCFLFFRELVFKVQGFFRVFRFFLDGVFIFCILCISQVRLYFFRIKCFFLSVKLGGFCFGFRGFFLEVIFQLRLSFVFVGYVVLFQVFFVEALGGGDVVRCLVEYDVGQQVIQGEFFGKVEVEGYFQCYRQLYEK